MYDLYQTRYDAPTLRPIDPQEKKVRTLSKHKRLRATSATLLSASLALTLAACANSDDASQQASQSTSASAESAGNAETPQTNDKAKPVIDELNKVFEEAEANVEWQQGYYRDVYSRVLDGANKLVDATKDGDNPQLELDATILRSQAQAMLDEEDNFEQENRPAQLENRYTRADMQLWRDRLAFALENPHNLSKPTDGIGAVSQDGSSANDGELKDLETYSDKVGDFDLDFTVMPTGSFQMGGDRVEWDHHDVDDYRQDWESPKHEVSISKRFGIMPTEVTREMFAAFVEDTGYATAPNGVGFPEPPDSTEPTSSMYREGVTWQEPGIPQDSDKHPVVQVSRADAEAFAEWLSAKTGQKWRLPSEAEWEYAARAGTDTAYFWGEDVNDGAEYAAGYDRRTDEATGYGFSPIMEADDGAAYTAEVKSYKPNLWGLYDMTGNAREWVSDYWEPNLESGPSNEEPRTEGVSTFPVLRGGAWDYMPQNLRIAYRSAYYNNYIHSTMWGFRLVREL